MNLQDELQKLAGRLLAKGFHDAEEYRSSLEYLNYAASELAGSRDLLLTGELPRRSLANKLLFYKLAIKRRNAILEGIERECNLPEEYKTERLRRLRRINEADKSLCMELAYDKKGKPIHEKPKGEEK